MVTFMKNEILSFCFNSKDLSIRTINKNNNVIDILFFESLCDKDSIEEFIIGPLNRNYILNSIEKIITGPNIKVIVNKNDAVKELLNGSTIIILNNNKIYAIETKVNLDRSISESSTEGTIVGPKDSFNENFNTNIGLIRKRLKSNNLCLETSILGTESNTKIGILYMNNIVDKDLVRNIKEKIKSIKNDIIIDGSYIKERLLREKILPSINQTERPDLAVYSLLEGKVCIVTENSPNILIIPTFFIDFFHSPEDYYQKNITTSFLRILRLLAFIIAVFLPGFYISITTHNPTSIPTNLLLKLIEQHESVPFPAFFEILIMTLTFEILRESDIKSPAKVGSSSSILGGLILGEAAVSAGIISPILIIIVAISSISSFVFPYNSIVNQIRFYKLLNLFLGCILGIFGLFIGLIILITNISSINSFGFPYTYPFVPLIKKDLKDSFIKINQKNNDRNPILAKDLRRI